MVRRYRFSALAASDLREIVRYTARQWGAAQVTVYQAEIQRIVGLICADPFLVLSRARDDLSPQCRSILVGKHYLFYRIGADKIEILRILHQRMAVGAERLP